MWPCELVLSITGQRGLRSLSVSDAHHQRNLQRRVNSISLCLFYLNSPQLVVGGIPFVLHSTCKHISRFIVVLSAIGAFLAPPSPAWTRCWRSRRGSSCHSGPGSRRRPFTFCSRSSSPSFFSLLSLYAPMLQSEKQTVQLTVSSSSSSFISSRPNLGQSSHPKRPTSPPAPPPPNLRAHAPFLAGTIAGLPNGTSSSSGPFTKMSPTRPLM